MLSATLRAFKLAVINADASESLKLLATLRALVLVDRHLFNLLPFIGVRGRYKITFTFLTILLRLLMPVTAFQCCDYF
jgi:hypothetical protein